MKNLTFADEYASSPIELDENGLLTSDSFDQLNSDSQRLVSAAVGRTRINNDREFRKNQGFWESVYYTTEAGKKWLERKKKEAGDDPSDYSDYSRAIALLEDPEKENRRARLVPTYSSDGVKPLRDLGFTSKQPEVLSKFSDEEEAEVKQTLTHLSAAWAARLSPEEVEAVSWVTSNGSSVLNHFLSGLEHPVWGSDVYSHEHLKSTHGFFVSAMAKAPRIEKPITIYRGTSGSHWGGVKDLLSRPASSSVHLRRAASFAGRDSDGASNDSDVILEIRTNVVPSVAGMSAWGASEMEVLSPLGDYRVVDDFVTHRCYSTDENGKPDFHEKFDKVRVIQLEYLG